MKVAAGRNKRNSPASSGEPVRKVLAAVKFAFNNFGPGIVFYVANHFWGLKIAVLGTLVFVVVEVAEKLWHRKPISLFFKFCAVVALLFGGIDFYLQKSVFFKYEATLTNLFTAVFFGSTLWGEKSMIHEFAEPRMAGSGHEITPGHVAYFRVLTGVWTAYFVLKATVYAVIASRYSLERGLLIRAIVGNVSMYALMGVSIFLSKPIYLFLKDRGLLSTGVGNPAQPAPKEKAKDKAHPPAA
ncbi:MAG: hypothetical protein HKL90_10575 [Elusimicrobia bacterium]|nr:hypothetical protein [Elusimicrobiota bacterium]